MFTLCCLLQHSGNVMVVTVVELNWCCWNEEITVFIADNFIERWMWLNVPVVPPISFPVFQLYEEPGMHGSAPIDRVVEQYYTYHGD